MCVWEKEVEHPDINPKTNSKDTPLSSLALCHNQPVLVSVESTETTGISACHSASSGRANMLAARNHIPVSDLLLWKWGFGPPPPPLNIVLFLGGQRMLFGSNRSSTCRLTRRRGAAIFVYYYWLSCKPAARTASVISFAEILTVKSSKTKRGTAAPPPPSQKSPPKSELPPGRH